MSIYREEDFYKDNGSPPEEYIYCDYYLTAKDDAGFESDYDQFAYVVNSFFPYIRLARVKGNSRLPCGLCASPSTDGSFAQQTSQQRDVICPKIAWGIAAKFVANLSYDDNQQDYVLRKDMMQLFQEYYNRSWGIYKRNHNGLRFSDVPIEQKEIHFIEEHLCQERTLWGRSTPLQRYVDLNKYAFDAKTKYEAFLQGRKIELEGIIMASNNLFSTSLGKTFETEYVKVFFLDDSVAPKAQEVVRDLNSVRRVNITEYKGAAHPGQSLTVYPKSMVPVEICQKEVNEALNQLFHGASHNVRPVRTEAFFDDIERQIINDLDMARVSIHVAMSWFTNQRIADKLVEKFKEGLDVKVVSFDDHTNAKFGVDLGAIPHKMVKGTKGGIMHNKYCIIDNQRVLTGSYNWSEKAENKNDENVSVIHDDARASDYSVSFRELFESA